MSSACRLVYCWFGLLPNLPQLLQSGDRMICLLNLPNMVTATSACHNILAKSSQTRPSLNAAWMESMHHACIRLTHASGCVACRLLLGGSLWAVQADSRQPNSVHSICVCQGPLGPALSAPASHQQGEPCACFLGSVAMQSVQALATPTDVRKCGGSYYCKD